MLQRYSPYKDLEDEVDKEVKLRSMIQSNAENFSQVKKTRTLGINLSGDSHPQENGQIRAISFGNSMTLERAQSLEASPTSKNPPRRQLHSKQDVVENFEGLIEGNRKNAMIRSQSHEYTDGDDGCTTRTRPAAIKEPIESGMAL